MCDSGIWEGGGVNVDMYNVIAVVAHMLIWQKKFIYQSMRDYRKPSKDAFDAALKPLCQPEYSK